MHKVEGCSILFSLVFVVVLMFHFALHLESP